MSIRRRWLLLLAIGLAQMAGNLAGIDWLRGLAAASAASPAPKVFTSQARREPFSTQFTLLIHAADGATGRMEITPERYARLRGPYNRRNAFGAVLAIGPVLSADPRTNAGFVSVARYALCGRAPLLRELGFDVDRSSVASVELDYEARAKAVRPQHERLRMACP